MKILRWSHGRHRSTAHLRSTSQLCAAVPRVSQVAEALPRSQIRKVMELAWAAERAGRRVIHLEVGQPDLPAPEEAVAATKLALDDPISWRYCPNAGEILTRQLIAEFIERRTGCPTSFEEIVVSVGVNGCLSIVFSALLDVGDEILMPDPLWPNCDMAARLFGATPLKYRTPAHRGFQPDLAEIEALITPRTKAIYTCSPNNPTGKVLQVDFLDSLIRLCKARNLFLISDEIYGEIIFEPELQRSSCLRSTAAREAQDHIIWMGGVSKAFAMTGFRVGFVRVPRRLVPLLEKNQEALLSCGVPFSQRGAAAALASERSAALLDEAVRVYGRRRDLAVQALSEAGLPLPRALVPQGAFYMLVPCGPSGGPDLSEDAALALLEAEGVACAPGGGFGVEAENFLRLSFATSDADVREGTARLARFLRAHRGAAAWWPK